MSSQSKYMENCPKGAMRHFNGDHLPEGTREMNSLCWSKFNFSGQHVLIHRVLVFASLSGVLSDAIEHCYSRYNHGEYIFWLLWSKRIEQYSIYLDVSFLAIVDGFLLFIDYFLHFINCQESPPKLTDLFSGSRVKTKLPSIAEEIMFHWSSKYLQVPEKNALKLFSFFFSKCILRIIVSSTQIFRSTQYKRFFFPCMVRGFPLLGWFLPDGARIADRRNPFFLIGFDHSRYAYRWSRELLSHYKLTCLRVLVGTLLLARSLESEHMVPPPVSVMVMAI